MEYFLGSEEQIPDILMIVGVLKNSDGRVMLMPPEVRQLKRKFPSLQILIESGAGDSAGASDADFQEAGAIVSNRSEILQKAVVLFSMDVPDEKEVREAGNHTLWISMPFLAWAPRIAERFIQVGSSLFALDRIPRITRAQFVDVLSSQATVSGYAAIVLAAERLSVLMPMLSTAAGTIRPVEVLVIGAGVAGLQAIATARRLGARVYAMDVRPGVREQVESVGGIFVQVEGAREEERGGYAVEQTEEFLERQREVIRNYARRCRIIVSTAVVPGAKAPLLIPTETVEIMAPGSVIVDMAARFGGNCALTRDGEEVQWKKRIIIGDSNLPARFPETSSLLLSRNMFHLLEMMLDDTGNLRIPEEDEIFRSALVVWNGTLKAKDLQKHLAHADS